MGRRLVVVALLVAVMVFGAVAPAHALHWETSRYYTLAWSWEYYGPYDPDYNCLAYALGVDDRWIWPWHGDPSALEINRYMTERGHPPTSASSSPRIIAYAKPQTRSEPSRARAIDHFSRIIDAGTTRAKWGTLEIMTSYSWSPYYASSYGLPATYYR